MLISNYQPHFNGFPASNIRPPHHVTASGPHSNPQHPLFLPPGPHQAPPGGHWPHTSLPNTTGVPSGVPPLNNYGLPPPPMTATPKWILSQDGATSESSNTCDNEEIKYGPFSDTEADKCHYRARNNRSRSLPRRPASSMISGQNHYHYQCHPLQQPQAPQVPPQGTVMQVPPASAASNLPHYVTLSRAAMLEAGDARLFEQQSVQFRPNFGQYRSGLRYSSQPQLNGNNILDFQQPRMPQTPFIITTHEPEAVPPRGRPEIKPKPRIRTLSASPHPVSKTGSGPPPKYQQPVSQQVSLENSDYLFPDLPPPPDALLDNTTASASPDPPSFQQNSRCSSLDDLTWVTSAAEMSRSLQQNELQTVTPLLPPKMGFHRPSGSFQSDQRSHTLPSQPSTAFKCQQPISIMKKRASNPIELRRSSGAVKVDLSSADKTIRRPGSEPDLKMSPMRSSIRNSTGSNDPRYDPKRLSGMSQGSMKKVMFSGLASDDGENDDSQSHPRDPKNGANKPQDPTGGGGSDVWVLRYNDPLPGSADLRTLQALDDDVPVTGVVIAQPQPCKFVLAQQQQMLQQQQSACILLQAQTPITSVSPTKKTKATPPPPPPRTTPVNPNNQGASAAAGVALNGNGTAGAGGVLEAGPQGAAGFGPRPPNPNVQRPAQHGQFHESPDEGYHEDDAGSEVL